MTAIYEAARDCGEVPLPTGAIPETGFTEAAVRACTPPQKYLISYS